MIISICLIIFVSVILGKDVKPLMGKLKSVDWKFLSKETFETLQTYGMKAGKVAVRPLLQFYFVMNSDKTTAIDKVLIIGSIFYIISPMNILPVSIYKFLGVIDEGAALMYVYHKIKDLITPAINLKVDEVLEIWFGPEYTVL
jgi:uncharacterized membrane protein YkvA (DUF1232 family)